MLERIKKQVLDLISGPLLAEGCEVADLVLSRYRNDWTVKVFVYSANGPTVDECARLSRLVGDLLDGTELFESGYTLELSSPGLDRPLKTARDFKYRVGEEVKIAFVDAKRKKVKAIIRATSGTNVDFEGDDGPFTLDLDEIDSARIVF
jgi:ribosome maturation factor RimP